MVKKYRAAYYRQPDGWLVVSVLDFPGVHSQGKNLREARLMIKDALTLMAECCLEADKPLPKPNRRAKNLQASFHEDIALEIKARALTMA
ncbi:MAG: type II toxin-antitoxin system HicB family antitoxin [Gemmataceae bacterium]|nr:type II toxin-antitoxin system HicB family antitoxin [Gemmataceae bacterium]